MKSTGRKDGKARETEGLNPTGGRKRSSASRATGSRIGREPRGVQRGIADADKKARTGKTEEPVRNTPPAGAWNDTSAD
jgi:hypothetical protein